MRVVIIIEPWPGDTADPTDETGLTEDAFNRLMDALGSIGDLITIDREDEEDD